MMKHILKTDPAVFQAVADGAKTYEIRLNDRGFAVGDELLLRETTHTGAEIARGAALEYTGREITKHIGHVLGGYGLQDGWVILSFAERTTAPVSLTDEQAWTIITEICGTQLTRVGSRKFQVVEINDMATAGEIARALLAAAPAPIQQVPTTWCTDAHFEAWCERHDMRKDRSDHRQMFDDAASLYLTVPVTPPALSGSQVQAAGDAVDAARYRWLRDPNRGMESLMTTMELDSGYSELKCGDDLDSAIDAAMR